MRAGAFVKTYYWRKIKIFLNACFFNVAVLGLNQFSFVVDMGGQMSYGRSYGAAPWRAVPRTVGCHASLITPPWRPHIRSNSLNYHLPPPPPPAVWQLLTGQMPFAQMRYAEVVYKVTIANIRPAFPVFAPTPLRQLAEDCWQSDEAARPSFSAIQARLAELILDSEGMRQRAGEAAAEAAAGGGDNLGLQSPWISHCNFDM